MFWGRDDTGPSGQRQPLTMATDSKFGTGKLYFSSVTVLNQGQGQCAIHWFWVVLTRNSR